MALDKDILGAELYDMRNAYFNNKTADELITEYGSIEAARLEACKKEAEVIINHFVNNAELTVPGTGMVAPSGGGAVSGSSTTGTIA